MKNTVNTEIKCFQKHGPIVKCVKGHTTYKSDVKWAGYIYIVILFWLIAQKYEINRICSYHVSTDIRTDSNLTCKIPVRPHDQFGFDSLVPIVDTSSFASRAWRSGPWWPRRRLREVVRSQDRRKERRPRSCLSLSMLTAPRTPPDRKAPVPTPTTTKTSLTLLVVQICL